jgi:hypothetical protein
MVDRTASFFPARINQRVPDLVYVADITNNARQQRVDFGVVPTIANVATFTAATAAQTATTGFPVQISGAAAAKWGRCITIQGGTNINTIYGRDYLGQRIAETFTTAGTAVRTSVKAFAWVDYVASGSNANATDVVTIGTTDKLGLPFSAIILSASLMNGNTAGAHTFVARDDTSPATGVTTDPRGTVALSTPSNGTRTFGAIVQLDTRNLHGVAAFAG